MRTATVLCLLVLPLAAVKVSAQPTAPPSAPATPASQPITLNFSGWRISPAGAAHVRIGDMPLKMILSPDGRTLAAVCGGFKTGLALIDVRTRQVKQFIDIARCWNGVAFSSDAREIYLSGGNSNEFYVLDFNAREQTAKLAHTFNLDPTDRPPRGEQPANFFAGIAIPPGGRKLYICNEAKDEVWVVDPSSGKVESTLHTGDHPHTCVFGSNPRYLYVSNWGDKSVSVLDLMTQRQALRLNVGVRPNDMVLAPDGRLFIACAGDNTVYVVNTKTPAREKEMTESAPPPNNAMEIISTSLYVGAPEGSTPCGLAIAPGGKALFVANADNNDVAVIDIADGRVSNVVGFVPAGWYPTSVASDGHTLFVGTGKGLDNMGPNAPSRMLAPRHVGGIFFDHPTGLLQGHVSFVDEPTGAELAAWTKQVRDNTPYKPETMRVANDAATNSIIPSKTGENQNCPIKHVLYIIKENRTYDQMYGDMKDATGKPIGDGDPNLNLFGEDVTPNQHQLARDYVLMDRLFCNSEVSVDGHSWCDGAIATDYRQRSWTVSYTKHGVLPGSEELRTPTNGFLWDLCRRNGVSFKCYGEGAGLVPNVNRGTWTGGRDKDRVIGWINDLKKAEETGEASTGSAQALPQFMIMALGENHTHGTTPGDFTPKACVASNDIGVGRIVEAASRSKFWNQMAIFIIEDDAQNGPDHVDAHRTDGLVISPWVKRGVVDSTPYTQTSMVRTMELILGLPPMTQYDAAARPMYSLFQDRAESVVFTPLTPKVDIEAKNRPNAPGARASAAMDFSEPDEAPEDELNRILWAAVKGEDVPYPTPIHRAVFVEHVE